MKRHVATAPGQVRIIGGSLRGSKLAVPASAGLRPKHDRVRETLFNWLQPVIAGARCLDLCAGTGALGIEALSRGAARVTFVERSPVLAQALRENLARLRQTTAEVRCADALAVLAEAPESVCNLVFLDPPFADDLWSTLASALEQSAWIDSNTLIYMESALHAPLDLPSAWRCHKEGHAGQVRFALYRRHEDVPLS